METDQRSWVSRYQQRQNSCEEAFVWNYDFCQFMMDELERMVSCGKTMPGKTVVEFEFIDRGVQDWLEFFRRLFIVFPHMTELTVRQNYSYNGEHSCRLLAALRQYGKSLARFRLFDTQSHFEENGYLGNWQAMADKLMPVCAHWEFAFDAESHRDDNGVPHPTTTRRWRGVGKLRAELDVFYVDDVESF